MSQIFVVGALRGCIRSGTCWWICEQGGHRTSLPWIPSLSSQAVWITTHDYLCQVLHCRTWPKFYAVPVPSSNFRRLAFKAACMSGAWLKSARQVVPLSTWTLRAAHGRTWGWRAQCALMWSSWNYSPLPGNFGWTKYMAMSCIREPWMDICHASWSRYFIGLILFAGNGVGYFC